MKGAFKKRYRGQVKWSVAETTALGAHERKGIHIYQPLRSGRIWHKVNF